MSLDDKLRLRLAALVEERGLSINALAAKAGLSESAIRAIRTGQTRSATRASVEKLAEALGVSPAHLLAIEQQPVNTDLLIELLKRLLRPLLQREDLIEHVARSLTRAYEVGRDSGVDPHNPREIDILTGLEVDRLQRAGKP